MSKIGRPTDNPKSTRITVRIDKECEDILTEYCKKNNLNTGQAVRISIKKLKNDDK